VIIHQTKRGQNPKTNPFFNPKWPGGGFFEKIGQTPNHPRTVEPCSLQNKPWSLSSDRNLPERAITLSKKQNMQSKDILLH